MTQHANKKWDLEHSCWIFDVASAHENFAQASIENGIVRWNSNNRVPFDDMLYDFVCIGAIDETTRQRSNNKRDADLDAFCQENRKRRPANQSSEELFELHANFEPGTMVVDIISRTTTYV
jgi:hypothetical protein